MNNQSNSIDSLTQAQKLISAAAGNTLGWAVVILVAWYFLSPDWSIALYAFGFVAIANLDIALKWHYQGGLKFSSYPRNPRLVLVNDLIDNCLMYVLIASILNFSPFISAEHFLAAAIVMTLSRSGLFFAAQGDL